ncbi:MAG: DUF4157 domain-containing protein [Niabella sp.]|nr:DUF4157 domain-containing protein [Niabella sp.]
MSAFAPIANSDKQHSTANAVVNQVPAPEAELVSGLPLQCKLEIGAVDDPLEKDADNMADKVMRMPEQDFARRKCAHCEEEEKVQRKSIGPLLQKKCAHCEEEEQINRKPLTSFVQRKTAPGAGWATDAVSATIASTKGSGNPLSGDTKSFMETRFDADFSDVKIHNGNNAAQLSSQLNAQAFTVGRDIYFNEGKYRPDTFTGRHLLAHELTHVMQQQNGSILCKSSDISATKSQPPVAVMEGEAASKPETIEKEAGLLSVAVVDAPPLPPLENNKTLIQRKAGDVSEAVPAENSGDIDLDIFATQSAYEELQLGILRQVFVVAGTTGILYNTGAYKEHYADGVIARYRIRSVDFPKYTLIQMANRKFAILAVEGVKQPDGTEVLKNTLMGWSVDTEENRKAARNADQELNMQNWFIDEKEKADFNDKAGAAAFAVVFVPGGADKSAGAQADQEEVPPMPKWMSAYKGQMDSLITAAKEKETFATDIPDTFFLYYSRSQERWRAGASQATPQKPIDVYFDILEKDNKAEKLEQIRDQVRIKQLSNPAALNKDSKPLDPSIRWAERLRLELEVLITAEKKKNPDNAMLPDATAIVTAPEDATLPFLQLWKYKLTSDAEGQVTRTLRAVVMSAALIKGTAPVQLLEEVKKVMLALQGEEVKAVNEDPKSYNITKEAFPAYITALNVREDFKSVTGGELQLHMNVIMGHTPGMDLLGEASTRFRGMFYTWDVYRVSEVMPAEELNTLSADWATRRKELQEWFKNSGQLKSANPALKETQQTELTAPLDPAALRFWRNAGLTYGLATSYDATGTITMPMTEGEYVVFCRALVEPYENVFRYPSEAFFPVKLIDGYRLATQISDERKTEIEQTDLAILDEKDPKKKKRMEERLKELQAQEKRTLTQAADFNDATQGDMAKLAQKLSDYYETAKGASVPELIAADLKKGKLTQDDFDKLLDLWMYVETNDVTKKPLQQLKSIIRSAEKNQKQIREMKQRAGKFSEDLEGYTIIAAPVVGLVSRVTGQPYPLLMTMGVKEDAEGTHVLLVDVTTEETMGKYSGDSNLGLWSAVQEAFNAFGEKCKYGEGYIAYRLPDEHISGVATSAPGFWENVKSILGKVAAVAGIAALLVGAVFTGGALAVVAGYVGVGALVIGGALAADNIYDRAVNHRLHADVELAMDVLNIAGPVLQGAGALAKLSSVSTLTKLVRLSEAAGELSAAEKTVMTVAAIAKLENLVMIGKTLAILQKGEAITNLGLVGYKTYKDLAMVAEVYADDPAKMRAMQAEIIRNALIAGTFAIIALKNEFKLRSPDELEGLVNNLVKEKDYEAAMIRSGIKDAAGNWKDPRLKEYFLGKGKEKLEQLDAPKQDDETVKQGAGLQGNGEKQEPDKYETDRKVPMKGHAETPDRLHEVEAYPDGTLGRCSSVVGARCPLLQAQFKDVIAERPVLKKRLDKLTEEINAFGAQAPKAKMDELAALEQRMRQLQTVREVSGAPKGYKIIEIGYNDDVDLPLANAKAMIEYPKGERVWRGADGGIYHEGAIGSSIGRQGWEHEFYTGTETGLATMKGTERAHSFGQGFGWESPYGLLNAPRFVNQKLQNNGIEQYIRGLRDLLPPGQQIMLRTRTEAVPGTRRLKGISYEGFILTAGGEKIPAFTYEINVNWKSNGGSIVDALPMKFKTSIDPAQQKILTDMQGLIPASKMPDYIMKPIHENITVN